MGLPVLLFILIRYFQALGSQNKRLVLTSHRSETKNCIYDNVLVGNSQLCID